MKPAHLSSRQSSKKDDCAGDGRTITGQRGAIDALIGYELIFDGSASSLPLWAADEEDLDSITDDDDDSTDCDDDDDDTDYDEFDDRASYQRYVYSSSPQNENSLIILDEVASTKWTCVIPSHHVFLFIWAIHLLIDQFVWPIITASIKNLIAFKGSVA